MEQETKQDIIGLSLAYLGVIILTILMATGVLAYYPGDIIIKNNSMPDKDLVFTLIGNETQLDIEIEVNTTNIKIKLPDDMIPQSFQIVFLENITNTITNTINTGGSGGGGSSGTMIKYVNRNITSTEYVDKNVPGETIYIEPDKPEVVSTGYSLFYLILFSIIGIIIGLVIYYLFNRFTDDYFEYYPPERGMINNGD